MVKQFFFYYVHCSRAVSASLVVDFADFPVNSKIIDFSQFSGSVAFGTTPVQVGSLVNENVTWVTEYNGPLILGLPSPAFYRFADNGDWTDGKTFAGVNAQPDNLIFSMRFIFHDGPVNFVGGFMNYTPDLERIRFKEARISALDAEGNILESYDLMTDAPISTPNMNNAGEYRGIQRAQVDIHAFELSNGVIAIDDLTFNRESNTVIPEPSSLFLFLFGFLSSKVLPSRNNCH